ncbi:hypothetical protein Prudu_015519, partial [Prunus dulcis]
MIIGLSSYSVKNRKRSRNIENHGWEQSQRSLPASPISQTHVQIKREYFEEKTERCCSKSHICFFGRSFYEMLCGAVGRGIKSKMRMIEMEFKGRKTAKGLTGRGCVSSPF